MPRRNLYILLSILAMSLICYHRADSGARNRYGPMFDTFVTAMHEIEERYLYEVPRRDLFEGAMHGMVNRLDPYSAYSGETETREFRESIGQEFGGVGIEVSWDRETESLTVLSPIVGSPAYDAGVAAGDRILKIGDESTENMSLPDAVERLRGRPGEEVRITVVHEGETATHELKLRRAMINVDTVLGDRRDAAGRWSYVLEQAPDVGYVRITHFGEKTSDELERVLAELRRHGVRGLILDLRNNPGGLLHAANETCDQFVRQGVVVTTRDRQGAIIERYGTTGGAAYVDWPIAVLVNRFSASAAEIVAACLQDHDRAVVVGSRTFGKGTVQTPITLEEGNSMLRLTTYGFWRPSGRNIHRSETATEQDVWGVVPSPGYEVALTEKQELEIARRRRQRDVWRRPNEVKPADAPAKDLKTEPASDPVVDKGWEYVRGKLSPPAAASRATAEAA